jgi:hypothetical protein
MKRAFGMFLLTKREQRVVIAIMFALVAIALAKHYHDVGTIAPMPSSKMSPVSTSSPDEERANPDDTR